MNPIINIASTAKKIEEGDLSIRIAGYNSGDEIGELARSFMR